MASGSPHRSSKASRDPESGIPYAVSKEVKVGAVDPLYQDEAQRTHLHHALLYGGDNGSIVDNLVKIGCDINRADSHGYRPIHLAAEKGFQACTKTLIDNGAEVDVLDKTGCSPLMIACLMGHVSVVAYLIQCNANVNLSNQRHETAVHFAASTGHRDCVKELIKAKAKLDLKDKDCFTPLMLACKNNYVRTGKILIDAGANCNIKDWRGNTVLHIAVEDNCEKCVRTILNAALQLDINATNKQGDTPMVVAIKRNYFKILDILIRFGCDTMAIDEANGTALGLAIKLEYHESVEVLLKSGMDPDEFGMAGMTPLMMAIWEMRVGMVELLLRYNADPNVKSRQGVSALYKIVERPVVTSEQDRHKVTLMLLRADADINCRMTGSAMGLFSTTRPSNFSIVGIAILSGQDWLVDMLMTAGACLTAEDYTRLLEYETGSNMVRPKKYRERLLEVVDHWKTTPRSLKQSCRIAIRHKLRNIHGRLMIEKVKDLPIPKRLHNFLDFEDLEQFCPEVVHTPRNCKIHKLMAGFTYMLVCGKTVNENAN